ncbi:MAG TPA: hypothetical protein VKW78_13390 [Terriglobales bacterium]|nr:hypothetical protein [Terriglobales bacterium]
MSRAVNRTAGAVTTVPGMPTASLTLHKYLPFAALYLLFNSVGLPMGLLYTTALAPLLYFWVIHAGSKRVLKPFLLLSFPFLVAQVSHGIASPLLYLRSYVLIGLVYVNAYAFYVALKNIKTLSRLFEQVTMLNFFLTVIAMLLRYTPGRELFWTDEINLNTGQHFSRLTLLVYEPSYLAMLLTPLLIFFLYRLILGPSLRRFGYFIMVAVPFVLSESYGGFAIVSAAVFLSLLAYFRELIKRRSVLISGVLLCVIVVLVLGTDNPISKRTAEIIAGKDSSTLSRTVFSYYLSFRIAALRSLWWGVGFGQSKVLGESIVATETIGFQTAVIPNAIAGTFAELGLIGVLLRLAIEIYLFFRTKVRSNCYRMAMFVAAFLFQFTGSYVTNIAEYVIWILAFTPTFPEMNIEFVKQSAKRMVAARHT